VKTENTPIKRKITGVLLSIAIIAASPFAASLAVRVLPQLTAALNKLQSLNPENKDNTSELIPQTKKSITDDINEPLSEGFGWQWDDNSTADEPAAPENNTPEPEAVTDEGVLPYPKSIENRSGTIVQQTCGIYSGTNFFYA
jgi:hypothetical protein